MYFLTHFGNCNYGSRQDVLNSIKLNESIAEVISTKEMAEIMGDLEISKIAKDIEQTIGCKFDEKTVDIFDASFNDVAEELIK